MEEAFNNYLRRRDNDFFSWHWKLLLKDKDIGDCLKPEYIYDIAETFNKKRICCSNIRDLLKFLKMFDDDIKIRRSNKDCENEFTITQERWKVEKGLIPYIDEGCDWGDDGHVVTINDIRFKVLKDIN